MKIPDKIARKEYREAVYDIPTEISIPGTKHIIKIKGLKPYTLERLTELWGKRDISIPRDSSETLKGMCIDPYFSIKCACMIALNSYWSIKLLYPIKWRIWAFLREYTEEQMLDIIAEGKKKFRSRHSGAIRHS